MAFRPRVLLFALSLLATAAQAVEFSGLIRSSTGSLPSAITVEADRRGEKTVLVGSVENGRYRIDLPSPGMYRVRLQAPGWDAEPKLVFDPQTTGARDFLLYPAKLPEPELAAELLRMGEEDQDFRKNIPKQPDAAFIKRWQENDRVREERLARIIAEKGWPRISQVGHRAANAAWLIAQHGTDDFLKRCLVLMKAAAADGEITPHHLALSIDRVLTQDKQKQIYGSQFQTNQDGKTFLLPVEDFEHIDERRASMGLEPFAEYRKNFEK